MSWSTFELLSAASPLARLVLVLLAAMSVAAGAVAVEKVRRLARAERAGARLMTDWSATRGAGSIGEPPPAATSPAARLFGAVTEVASAPFVVRREVYDRTIRRVLLTSAAELRRGLGVLATVGATAPFVGLFGTVVGIIDAFREIGAGSRGGIGGVSSGLAEALVATAAGILVAVPAVWLYNHLSQRIARLLTATEAFGEEIAVASLLRGAPGGPGPVRPHDEEVPACR